MKRTRPTHRRVRDAATPRLAASGPYLNRSVTFSFNSIGNANTTSVELSWWQIRDMLTRLRELNEAFAKQLEQEARIVRGSIERRDSL